MRAAVIETIGEPPALADVGEPERGEGQALIEVAAAALNPIDLSIGSGTFFAGPPAVPYVPGKEGVGRVLESDTIEVGAKVWFETPGGYGGNGALAERALAPQAQAIELPAGTDAAVAAALGIAGQTAWMALEWRAELAAGETVLVLGASGAVGQVAVQAAKLLGAGRVVAAARDAEALERAHALGADATVDLGAFDGRDELADAYREAAGGDIHVTIDPLWGEPGVAAALAAAVGGRIVQLGQSAGAEASVPSSAIRGKLLSLLGYLNPLAPFDARADAYRRLLEHVDAGRLEIAVETFALDRIGAAWERQSSSPNRKLVVVP